jgi:hypothetical protein
MLAFVTDLVYLFVVMLIDLFLDRKINIKPNIVHYFIVRLN